MTWAHRRVPLHPCPGWYLLSSGLHVGIASWGDRGCGQENVARSGIQMGEWPQSKFTSCPGALSLLPLSLLEENNPPRTYVLTTVWEALLHWGVSGLSLI